MTALQHATGPQVLPETAFRAVRAAGRDEPDPAEPWEAPISANELAELSTKRFERLPHRPANPDEVPPGAVDALVDAVGAVGLDELFVIPRAPRTVGVDRAGWVAGPTQVIAVGQDAIAAWIDEPAGGRVRAVMPFRDVLAVLDRSILLYGRLELVGAESSLVVRYNTVGQPELRALLLRLRRHAPTIATPVPAGGTDPGTLPHKWMALLHSSDVQARGRERLLVAAGDLAAPVLHLHDGVAVLTAAELVIATDPTPDVRMAQYGVDLLAVPRARLLALEGGADHLRLTVRGDHGTVRVSVAAHESLVMDTLRVIAPVLEATPG